MTKLTVDILSARQRMRRVTDLNNFYRFITKKHPDIKDTDFLNVFKKLDNEGAGSLIIGRKNNPNRFIWNYNLKEVAESLKKGKDISSLKLLTKKSKQRRVSKRDVKPIQEQEVVAAKHLLSPQIVIQFSPETPQTEIKALLELVRDLQMTKR